MDIPTYAELNFWVAFAIIVLAFIAFAWFMGKKEEENYIPWIRDWNEYDVKEDWE